jgi:hypothetical protein
MRIHLLAYITRIFARNSRILLCGRVLYVIKTVFSAKAIRSPAGTKKDVPRYWDRSNLRQRHGWWTPQGLPEAWPYFQLLDLHFLLDSLKSRHRASSAPRRSPGICCRDKSVTIHLCTTAVTGCACWDRFWGLISDVDWRSCTSNETKIMQGQIVL